MSEATKSIPRQLEVIRGTSVVPPSLRPAGSGPQVAMTMFPDVYNCNAVAEHIALTWNSHDALVSALENCDLAINPTDRSSISMHEWNKRLKSATEQAHTILAQAKEQS